MRLHPLLVGGGEFGTVSARAGRGWVWVSALSSHCVAGKGVRESVRWAGARAVVLVNIFFWLTKARLILFGIKFIFNNDSYLSLGWRFLMIFFLIQGYLTTAVEKLFFQKREGDFLSRENDRLALRAKGYGWPAAQ